MSVSLTNPKRQRGSVAGWYPRLRVGLVIVLAMLAGGSNAAEVTAKSSTDSVQVAEPFMLDVTVVAPTGAKVTFPAITDKIGEFDVRDSQDAFDVPTGEDRTWTRHFTLESITTGDLAIPSLDIQINEQGKATVVQSQPIYVRVASVLEDRSDPTKFRDIQSVVDIDVPVARSNSWVWWTLSGTAAMCLFAIAGMVLSRRGKWLTPLDWAIEELDELESSVDENAVECEELAQKLSEIVRSYLLLEFGIADAGRTPQELVQEIITGQRIESKSTDRLSSLFSLADKARFAGLKLSNISLKSAIKDSRELVQKIATDFESSRGHQTLDAANLVEPISGETGYENKSETN